MHSEPWDGPGGLPIHALLATDAVHHHLSKEELRCNANILIENKTARDSHQIAPLIEFGPPLSLSLPELCRATKREVANAREQGVQFLFNRQPVASSGEVG